MARSVHHALLAAGIMLLAYGAPAQAADLPEANKLIAFVRAEGCPLDTIRRRVRAAADLLVRDTATTWVALNFAANPENNVDAIGNPSPYIAAVEANAPAAAVSELMVDVQRALSFQCHVDVYAVHERRVIPLVRTWSEGKATPEAKIFRLMVRKPGITLQKFNDEWAGPHAQIVLAGRSQIQPEQASQAPARRYVQHTVLSRAAYLMQATPNAPPIDGILESNGTIPTPESIVKEKAARAAPPQGENASHASTFVDTSKMTQFIAQEFILKD